ncbi:MAG: hypothetical protein ACP5NS_00370 [Candidatus Pacearchaeota archaeon]
MESRSIIPIQGQPCYVDYLGCTNGFSSYLVGTVSSPESPVGVRIAGTDSMPLRMRAVDEGLTRILEGHAYN